MTSEFVSALHIIAAACALLSGFAVVGLPKGTRRHKRFGYGYVASMFALNFSALSIFRLTDSFGPFHYGALFSLLTILAGFIPVLLRKPSGSWLEFHYSFMSWSFVGLLAAGASEAAVRLPSTPFWPAVGASTVLICVVGGAVIARRREPLVSALRTGGAQQRAPADGPIGASAGGPHES